MHVAKRFALQMAIARSESLRIAMTEKTLFREALAKTPTERESCLDKTCAGQPELRSAVEAMLADHRKAHHTADLPAHTSTETIDSPAAQPGKYTTLEHATAEVEEGTQIAGRYTLL